MSILNVKEFCILAPIPESKNLQMAVPPSGMSSIGLCGVGNGGRVGSKEKLGEGVGSKEKSGEDILRETRLDMIRVER